MGGRGEAQQAEPSAGRQSGRGPAQVTSGAQSRLHGASKGLKLKFAYNKCVRSFSRKGVLQKPFLQDTILLSGCICSEPCHKEAVWLIYHLVTEIG